MMFLQTEPERIDRKRVGLGRVVAGMMCLAGFAHGVEAQTMKAGTAKVEITDPAAGPVQEPLYAKALVISNESKTFVMLTIDAVAIGEIGPVGNDFLPKLRARLKASLGLEPGEIAVNASHCHGIVRKDSAELAASAVERAFAARVPVRVGAGTGQEERIMENRRMNLKDGSQTDVRHAYATVADDEIAAIGPVDPEIGILRLDRTNGTTLAVVYNFACHPIQGVPDGSNTPDFPGYASKAIEESIGGDCTAFFVQGCGGDINPVRYKEVDRPRDAEDLGNRLGLSVLRALKGIDCSESNDLRVFHETIELPKAADYDTRIAAMQEEQARLLKSLRGTSLNFDTFVPLYTKYALDPSFPSAPAPLYLREKQRGAKDLEALDTRNRADLAAYLANVRVMERLTRLQTNMDLLIKNRARNSMAGDEPLTAEIMGVRVANFALVTFPGELTVEIGLSIKKESPIQHMFVAGYTNGYLYYTPTETQRNNTGYAQEDCDCLVAPEWRSIFDAEVRELTEKLR